MASAMIKCVVSNNLTITGLPNAISTKLEKFCTFDLSKYSEDNIEIFSLFNRKGDQIILPKGCLPIILEYANIKKIKTKVIFNTVKGKSFKFNINSKLNYKSGAFKYQHRVVKELLNLNIGRLEAPTAAGKTTISCLYIALSGLGPTLFLVDQERLLNQFIESVEGVLGLDSSEIGIIKAQKFNLKTITVGSLQTLGRKDFDLNKISNYFHTVILDESHIAAALTYRNVILNLNCTNLFGISATPNHPSTLDSPINRLLECLLGPVNVFVSPEEIPGRLKPKIIIKPTYRSYVFKATRESPEWLKRKYRHKIQNEIALDTERNNLLVEDIKSLVKSNHKVLVTVQRVFHGQELKKLLEDLGLKVSFPYKYSKSDIEKAMVDHKQLNIDVDLLNKNKISIMIGTLSLFKKGFNAPSLSALVYAAPFAGNSTTIIQSVGRILRHFPGKSEAVVLDYIDNSTPNNVLGDWSLARELLLLEESDTTKENL